MLYLVYQKLDQQRLGACEHRNRTMTTTKQDIEKLRNENEEYKRQLQDGALNENLQNDIREWITSNNRQIEDMEKRITTQTIEQEKRSTEEAKQITLEKQLNLELSRTQGKSAASTDSLLKFHR